MCAAFDTIIIIMDIFVVGACFTKFSLLNCFNVYFTSKFSYSTFYYYFCESFFF